MAAKHYGRNITIHHGSVTDMPFDEYKYDGIFCYGLIYLPDESERLKLISDCYDQLSDNGYMVFTVFRNMLQPMDKESYAVRIGMKCLAV